MIIVFILIINGPKVEKNISSSKEIRSIFISYIEISKYLYDKDEVSGKEEVNLMINNIKEMGFNEVILQVRSFCDAIYSSEIFPWSKYISSTGNYSFDVLDYFIEACHKFDIKVIGWINPYRISNQMDLLDISFNSPAYKYLNSDYVYVNDGMYFNPSKKEVKELIISGIKEILDNYEIDGILFDDYFYPDNEIDIEDYNNYLINNKYISKEEYNLSIINDLVKDVYKLCHEYNVLFGISPDGNIDNNYNKVFCDVKRWGSSSGYVDFIMPQIYYGFYNETKPFKNVVEEWEKIVSNDDVSLRVALAFYKVGSVDEYAKSGSYEWLIHGDIIMREIVLSRNLDKYQGFGLFRYDYLFNSDMYNEMTLIEIENLKKVLN